MNTRHATRLLSPLFPSLIGLCLTLTPSLSSAQDPAPGSPVNITTWHQDIPSITSCPTCVYRTGQNLLENAITVGGSTPISPQYFGQQCASSSTTQLDGQIYGQPLVVTNVKYSGQTYASVVYVVTQNGSIYAFDGTPPTTGQTCNLIAGPVPLFVNSTYTAVNCSRVGGGACQTIAPNASILGTPVISANTGGSTTTGTIYVVSEAQAGSDPSVSYFHWLLGS
jgi:hypothetical protein